ncbi:MAG: hypothetical protein M1839_001974 [Geoglossum umbratile]|nr:MAG: hypothetical protein M1839_001974 [Geoglossum umbratile]
MPVTSHLHQQPAYTTPYRRRRQSQSRDTVDTESHRISSSIPSGPHQSRQAAAGPLSERDHTTPIRLGLAPQALQQDYNISQNHRNYNSQLHQPPRRKHTRRGSLIPSSGIPVLQAPKDPLLTNNTLPTSSSSLQSAEPLSPPSRPYFSPPSGRSDFEPRSPPQKNRRAPASRSSNGVATSTGPPPALSTQRPYPTDAPRRSWNPTEFAFAQQALSQTGLVGLGAGNRSSSGTIIAGQFGNNNEAHELNHHDSTDLSKIPRLNHSRPDESMNGRTVSRYGEDLLEDDRDRTLRALEGDFRSTEDGGEKANGEAEGGEDIFLNLARSSSTLGETSSRRRSRLPTTSSHRQSLPPNSFSSPLSRPSHDPNDPDPLLLPRRALDDSWQHSHLRKPSQSQSSNQRSQAPARDRTSLHPSDDVSRVQRLGLTPRASFSRAGTNRETSPDSNSRYSQRPSAPDAPGGLRAPTYRQSNLGLTSSNADSPPLPDRSASALGQNGNPGASRADGTESTTSTNAPSTVWDEVDDMKSRIRNLELKLSASSGQAMSSVSGDRPWTANTTVTTLSSSPQRGRGNSTSPSGSVVPGLPGGANIHPLLHAALSKTKDLMHPDVYKALEAAASDALSIAAAMGNANQHNGISFAHSVIGSGGLGSLASDRQLRRKADSMCRSLTELCIAMSENRSEPSAPNDQIQPYNGRPASRDRLTGQLEGRPDSVLHQRLRGASQEPEGFGGISGLGRPSPRTMSRLEARRTSMYGLNGSGGNSNGNSPRGQESTTPTQSSSAPNSTRLGRTSTILLRNRQGDFDDYEDRDGSFRAPSRATTDIGYIRNPPREYTSSQPLPDRGSPSSLPIRRHHISASVSSGSTPPISSNLSYSSSSINNNSNSTSQTTPRSRLLLDRSNPSTPNAYESTPNNNNNNNHNSNNITQPKLPAEDKPSIASVQGITGRLRTASLGISGAIPRRFRQSMGVPPGAEGPVAGVEGGGGGRYER